MASFLAMPSLSLKRVSMALLKVPRIDSPAPYVPYVRIIPVEIEKRIYQHT